MAAKIIPFPGPKQKTLLDLAERSESTVGQAPTPPRQLTDREVEHRRQMLMHLQLVRETANDR
jgi:hypothetical protein